MAFEKKITLETPVGEITFNVNAADYNKYINSTQPNNKVQPATNFVLNTVVQEDAKKLKELVQQPGAALFLVGAIVEEYQPEFNFTVKKIEDRAKQIGKSRLDQLQAYHAKYFGAVTATQESLAQALYLETQQQENFVVAVNNGICQALSE